eukprot:CAMPEP_0119427584 /NCGR_PEP_ID=MMETSP1335-20130426/38642_1 /TAXON_ID=259385 /ORGANISM="Chrysoculter rhomboideus, Strain RCC1486" /LENGTH=123 /DNA_ID=CAMNT_0007453225 /DNA_START=19 /DNA_END=387 /DNA_ORIENTATION=+
MAPPTTSVPVPEFLEVSSFQEFCGCPELCTQIVRDDFALADSPPRRPAPGKQSGAGVAHELLVPRERVVGRESDHLNHIIRPPGLASLPYERHVGVGRAFLCGEILRDPCCPRIESSQLRISG